MHECRTITNRLVDGTSDAPSLSLIYRGWGALGCPHSNLKRLPIPNGLRAQEIAEGELSSTYDIYHAFRDLRNAAGQLLIESHGIRPIISGEFS